MYLKVALKHGFSFKSIKNWEFKNVKNAQVTLGVNFINVQCTAFTLVDPESVKRY